MLMTPAGMALAAITVMLWILWSDTLRVRRPIPILYALRIALFLIVSAMLVMNMFRYPAQFSTWERVLAIVAALVGVVGAGYFGRRLVTRS